MRIQWKVILLVLAVLVISLSAVVWKTQALLLEDKISFITDSSIKQVAVIRKFVESRFEQEKSELVRFATEQSKMRAGDSGVRSGRNRNFGGFDVISLVQIGTDHQWAPAWTAKNPAVKSERWPSGHELTLIKSLPFSKVKDGEVTWVRVSDPQGLPVYAILVAVEVQGGAAAAVELSADSPAADLPETTMSGGGGSAVGASDKRAIVVGFASANPLVSVADEYIGSINTVFLVDDRGYVASHTAKSFLGALFTEHPIVKEIVKSQKSAETGHYEDLENQQVIGHYERIDHTNMFAVITTPMKTVTGVLEAHLRLALVIGAAVGFVGLVFAWLLGRGISGPLRKAIGAVEAINKGVAPIGYQSEPGRDEVGTLTRLLAETVTLSPVARTLEGSAGTTPFTEMTTVKASSSSRSDAVEARNNAKAMNDRLASERRAAFEAFNEGFLAAVKEPVMAIIGHATLARSKTGDEAIHAHADSIEREAKRAKNVLERLQSFEAEQPTLAESDVMDLGEVARAVLTKTREVLAADGVEVIEEIRAVPIVRGSASQIEGVIEQLFENAREAMQARPIKRLRVRVEYRDGAVLLLVADTGIGMPRDVRERAFEPFFKGFESPRRMGLGLAFAGAALKRIGAVCDIETAPGEGATFKIKFHVTADEKKAFEARTSRVTSTAVAFPPAPAPTALELEAMKDKAQVLPTPTPTLAPASASASQAPISPAQTSITDSVVSYVTVSGVSVPVVDAGVPPLPVKPPRAEAPPAPEIPLALAEEIPPALSSSGDVATPTPPAVEVAMPSLSPPPPPLPSASQLAAAMYPMLSREPMPAVVAAKPPALPPVPSSPPALSPSVLPSSAPSEVLSEEVPAMLGGKLALAVDGGVPLPPAPLSSSDSSEFNSAEFDSDPEEAFEIVAPVPAGASVARPERSALTANAATISTMPVEASAVNVPDDDDDDDDHFSNVTLNRAVSTLLPPELSSETSLLSAHAAASGTSGSSAGFKVKIRKPKLKA